MYKVISYKLITKGRKVIGVDPESRQVEYLPDNGEGKKAMDRFIERLYKGFGGVGLEEFVMMTRNGKTPEDGAR